MLLASARDGLQEARIICRRTKSLRTVRSSAKGDSFATPSRHGRENQYLLSASMRLHSPSNVTRRVPIRPHLENIELGIDSDVPHAVPLVGRGDPALPVAADVDTRLQQVLASRTCSLNHPRQGRLVRYQARTLSLAFPLPRSLSKRVHRSLLPHDTSRSDLSVRGASASVPAAKAPHL